MKSKILVSACLCGVKCRYDASAYQDDWVDAYLKDKEVILVCPELLGGLFTPRDACEIRDGKVVTIAGEDVSEAFIDGANKVLELAIKEDIKEAVLKARSPSCGSNLIYDGTFSGVLIPGDGVCAKQLKLHGIKVLSEIDIRKMDEWCSQQKKA